MNTLRKISCLNTIIVIAFSILITISNVNNTTITTVEEKQGNVETNEQDDNQQSDASTKLIISNFEAIINLIHIDIHFESYLIHELNQICEITYSVEDFHLENPERYFKTLFRQIISPNAP